MPSRRRQRRGPADAALPGPELLRHLGGRLRLARDTLGKTRQELAREAGLSLRFLAALEAGKGNISILRLWDLLQVLGMDWEDLWAPQAGAHSLVPAQDRRTGILRRQIERRVATRSSQELDEIRSWLAQRFDGAGSGPVALLGLRGAGKTSVGRRLARALGLPFSELDELVESAAGMELQQVFELQGPARYRELERAALRRYLQEQHHGVLATGGGIVTEPQTYALLRRRCLTVWLRATPEEHWERVVRQGDRRPMQGNPAAMQELRALWAEREPLYGQARIVCDTRGRTLSQVARHLESTLRARGVTGRSNNPKRPRPAHFE